MWEAVQMLEAVLDSVDAAILMVDSDFQVVLCNKKFGEFFGLDPQSLIGEDKRAAITRDIKWRVKNSEDFQKRLFWLYENPEVTANDEVEVSLPRRRVLHRFSGPVYDKERKMLGRVEVYTDITDAKTLHEELELKNAHLYLLNAAATAINGSVETGQLSRIFLQRIKQVTGARAAILYIKEGKVLQLKATTGTLYNPQSVPNAISEDIPKGALFWGPDKTGSPLKSLFAALEGSFFIAFPALHQEEVTGLCILVWDTIISKWWFDESLFESVGIQLGIGIYNAMLHQVGQQAVSVPERKSSDINFHLSPREKQVLNGLAAGLSNKEIALALKISEYTVKNHVRSILGKLSVKTRGQAVAKAANAGLLKLSQP
ncbi:MAG TPA: PAS domain S-box protein [Clostridia bacterium]|jgi:PAS domain S-box-containing protein|nr:PAS domain S-box protein [Clostridia bacterium]